ncbi:MAG: hypothetical protein AMXMBFR47_07120 [Planctomycetota bacterium]
MPRLTAASLPLAALLLICGCAPHPVNRINTYDLVGDMYDLRRLAELPLPHYNVIQFSSFDRRSCVPGGAGWFENSDGFGGEPIPGFEAVLQRPGPSGVGEYLICDVKGPGAIVRTWTAAIHGELRVEIDGGRLYTGPAADFLTAPHTAVDRQIGLRERLLAEDLEKQMYAAYAPIPFSERCRITWVGNLKDPHFYHVTVRAYEPGTQVDGYIPLGLALRLTRGLSRMFSGDVAEEPDMSPPDAIPGFKRMLRVHATAMKEIEAAPISSTLAGNSSAEVLKLAGPRAIEQLELQVVAADMDRALRQTILHMHTEGQKWGDVQTPIGDFFGAAPGTNPYDSLPMSVDASGRMTCRFIMPFRESLRIVVENRGEQEVRITGEARVAPYEWTDRSMHFRAHWRVDHDLVGSHDQPQDLPFLIAGGQGRYVGTAVMLLNPCRLSTSWGNWWGEGDEKIFVDGDRVPSTFGTGSEDYFNYAWSLPDIFQTAYCAQPRNDGYGNRGFVSNVRWHILDDIPFNERIAFFMELFPHTRVPGMSYARISYYYARPGTYDDHVAIQDADLRHLELAANLVPAPEFMLKGAVFHEIETLLPAGLSPAFEAGPLWSGGKHVKFDGSKGPVKLRLPIEKDGNYELYLACARTPTSAVADVTIDGNPIVFSDDATSLKLFVPVRTLAREFVTKRLALTAGEHAIEIKMRPQPEVSGMGVTPGDAIGLDYIAVKPVK